MLQETKMHKEKVEQIKSLKNYSINASSLEGASGGTLMLWKKKCYSRTILNPSKYLMVAKITSIDH